MWETIGPTVGVAGLITGVYIFAWVIFGLYSNFVGNRLHKPKSQEREAREMRILKVLAIGAILPIAAWVGVGVFALALAVQ